MLKRVLSITIGCITALSICIVSYAYFCDKDIKSNPFRPAKNDTTITEEFPNEPLEPGKKLTKIPQVESIKSDKNCDSYVRVFCEFSDSKANDFATLDLNTKDWTEKQPDGYYYYKSILPVGEKTTPLFTSVQIADIPKDKLIDFDVIVYAESCNARSKTGDLYADYSVAFQAVAGQEKDN